MQRRPSFLLASAFALLPACKAPAPSEHGEPARAEGAESTEAADADAADLAPYFDGLAGTFVLLDAQTGVTVRHDPARARARFLPASTYKIPNTLIALETGVASGPDFALPWDPEVAPREAFWPEVWAQDHTLRTALPNSVVWFYQELARRIGAARMQAYVERFGYGNRDIEGGIDHFWLTGGLRISADEQVEFLRRFYFGELGVSARTTEITKALLVLDEGPSYRLSGKTGWAGYGSGEAQIGWFVGYLERGEAVYFFALNLDLTDEANAPARRAITEAILRDRGLIDL
jgi:beta-lactamase class D